MKVREIMSINSVRILNTATMAQAADLAAVSNASGLFVVDQENTFIGVLSEGDMMGKVLPEMSEVFAEGGGLRGSYDIFSEKGAKLGGESIDRHLIGDPITLDPDDELLKAAATMAMKKMRRLPVVKNGKLVGTISRGDICKAVLKS
jgi:predicted transcriptional regulator